MLKIEDKMKFASWVIERVYVEYVSTERGRAPLERSVWQLVCIYIYIYFFVFVLFDGEVMRKLGYER